jgi:hypothetical protein
MFDKSLLTTLGVSLLVSTTTVLLNNYFYVRKLQPVKEKALEKL